jgi:metal-sulfur cluster biosynthetic enzyme
MSDIAIITNDADKAQKALAALKNVTDPEIGLNVVDLGLVYQIDFDVSGKKVYCTHTLTTQFCPMGDSIQKSFFNALQSVFPGEEIILKVVFEPHWNAAMVSAKGREFLNK